MHVGCLVAHKNAHTGITRRFGRSREELRARAPDFAGNRAANRKSKNYVGQAVLMLPTSLATELPTAKAKATSGKLCSKGSQGILSKQCSLSELHPRSGLEAPSGRDRFWILPKAEARLKPQGLTQG
jgi:hypothetical protein